MPSTSHQEVPAALGVEVARVVRAGEGDYGLVRLREVEHRPHGGETASGMAEGADPVQIAPLSANEAYQRPDTWHRLRAFLDACGLDEDPRCRLVPLLRRRARSMSGFLKELASVGAAPGARYGMKATPPPGPTTPTGFINAKNTG